MERWVDAGEKWQVRLAPFALNPEDTNLALRLQSLARPLQRRLGEAPADREPLSGQAGGIFVAKVVRETDPFNALLLAYLT